MAGGARAKDCPRRRLAEIRAQQTTNSRLTFLERRACVKDAKAKMDYKAYYDKLYK